MQINDQIIFLITSQLQGSASTEEATQLQQWIDAAPENRAVYLDLVKIWENSNALLQQPVFDSHAAWNKLDAIIQRREQQAIVVPVRSLNYKKWLAVAAAILVIATAGWFGWNNFHARSQKVTASVNNEMVELPDGSSVLLRKGSTIRYPATFKRNERNVELTGEAFFQVQHNDQKPFNITTDHSKVTVLGTSFLVDASKTADKVVVVTGKVKVAATSSQHQEVVLTAGQEVLVEADLMQQSEVTDSNFLSWKTGVLDFKDASLSKVLKDIEHYYNTPILLEGENQDSAPSKLRLNVQFKNQSLEQVTEEIRLLTGLYVKKAKDSLIFYKK